MKEGGKYDDLRQKAREVMALSCEGYDSWSALNEIYNISRKFGLLGIGPPILQEYMLHLATCKIVSGSSDNDLDEIEDPGFERVIHDAHALWTGQHSLEWMETSKDWQVSTYDYEHEGQNPKGFKDDYPHLASSLDYWKDLVTSLFGDNKDYMRAIVRSISAGPGDFLSQLVAGGDAIAYYESIRGFLQIQGDTAILEATLRDYPDYFGSDLSQTMLHETLHLLSPIHHTRSTTDQYGNPQSYYGSRPTISDFADPRRVVSFHLQFHRFLASKEYRKFQDNNEIKYILEEMYSRHDSITTIGVFDDLADLYLHNMPDPQDRDYNALTRVSEHIGVYKKLPEYLSREEREHFGYEIIDLIKANPEQFEASIVGSIYDKNAWIHLMRNVEAIAWIGQLTSEGYTRIQPRKFPQLYRMLDSLVGIVNPKMTFQRCMQISGELRAKYFGNEQLNLQ